MTLGNFDFPGNHFSNFFMKILLLFHGSADVEGGFTLIRNVLW